MSVETNREGIDEKKPLRHAVARLTPAAKPGQAGEWFAPSSSPESADQNAPRGSDVPRGPNAKVERGAPMRVARLRRLGDYGLALLFVALAAGLRWAMPEVLRSAPFLVFYLAWVGAAAFGGLGPGLLATMASWLCIDLLFDYTIGRIDFANWTAADRLLVFLVGGLVVSIVGEKMRRARFRERRQAAELARLAGSLEGEKEILQSVMDGAKNSHLVYLDRDFNFVRVNEAYAGSCGYAPQEMIGKNHFVLYPHAENAAIFSRVRDTGVPAEFRDKPFVFPDQPERGTTYWDWTLTPVKNDSGRVGGLVFSLFETTQRKQAEEALRELTRTLESKVAQRTAELEHRARQLQKLTLELTKAEERERQRLAVVLHDDLQQVLAAARFHLTVLDGRVKNDAGAQKVAAQVRDLLGDAIGKSRSLSHELSSPALAQGDIAGAFESLAEQMRAKHGLAVRLDLCARVELASEPLRVLLYRAAQELLFNVVKHAGVREATLRLRRRHGRLCLSVSDKGQGLDPREIGKAGGFGLLSVRERTELLGGRMKIRSTKGKGSTFVLTVPDSDVRESALPREASSAPSGAPATEE
jgi:PAS domain S-box-containing protein